MEQSPRQVQTGCGLERKKGLKWICWFHPALSLREDDQKEASFSQAAQESLTFCLFTVLMKTVSELNKCSPPEPYYILITHQTKNEEATRNLP